MFDFFDGLFADRQAGQPETMSELMPLASLLASYRSAVRDLARAKKRREKVAEQIKHFKLQGSLEPRMMMMGGIDPFISQAFQSVGGTIGATATAEAEAHVAAAEARLREVVAEVVANLPQATFDTIELIKKEHAGA